MKFRVIVVTLLLCPFLFTQSATASYNGVIDYSNPRIVPIFHTMNDSEPPYSGYIYSSRIIFTAGHGEAKFSEDGTRLPFTPLPAFVGLPNTKVSKDLKRFPVVKRYLSTSMRFENGLLGDFAIYVLGEDIGDFPPAKLATLEIQKDLEEQRATVEITGYGDYEDRCKAGDQLPCPQKINSRSLEPRKLKVQVRPYEDWPSLVGYERPQLKGSLLTWGGGKPSPCSGDSGGSVTTIYKGEEIYVSVTPNGMNGYACGAAGYYDGKGGIGYASPIYNHLDILKEAENFVEAARAQEAAEKAKTRVAPAPSPVVTPTTPNSTPKKSSIICVKGKISKKFTAVAPKCPAGFKKK